MNPQYKTIFSRHMVQIGSIFNPKGPASGAAQKCRNANAAMIQQMIEAGVYESDDVLARARRTIQCLK